MCGRACVSGVCVRVPRDATTVVSVFACVCRGTQRRHDDGDDRNRYPDASLTSLGVEQGLTTGAVLEDVAFDYIVTSPMTRCLETCILLCQHGESTQVNNKRGRVKLGIGPCPVVVCPEAREFCSDPLAVGNVGSSPAVLQRRFRNFQALFDLDAVESIDDLILDEDESSSSSSSSSGSDSVGDGSGDSGSGISGSDDDADADGPAGGGSKEHRRREQQKRRLKGQQQQQQQQKQRRRQQRQRVIPRCKSLPDDWCPVEAEWQFQDRCHRFRRWLGRRFPPGSKVLVISHGQLFRAGALCVRAVPCYYRACCLWQAVPRPLWSLPW